MNYQKSRLFVRLLVSLILACSTALLCAHTISHNSPKSLYLAVCACCAIVGVVVFCRYAKLTEFIKENHTLCVWSLVLAACFSYGSYVLVDHNVYTSFIWRKPCYLLAYPAATLVFGFILSISRTAVRDIKNRLAKTDLIICLAFDAFFVILMTFYLFCDSNWFMQYDKVYSLDSGFCVSRILPNLNYFDIRHPILSSIAFPVWATATGLAAFAIPAQLKLLFCVLGVQILNIQMLVAIGAMLKAMTKSRTCLILFFAAFSTLLSAVAIEKYVLSCFLVVLTVYLLVYHAKYAPVGYVLSMGVMPTNAFLLLAEFVKKDSTKTKLKRIGMTLIVGVLVLVCCGHGNLLNVPHTLNQIHSMHDNFGSGNVSLVGRLIATMNIWQGVFLPLSVQAQGTVYIWSDLTTKIGWLAIPIFAVMVIGLGANRRDFIYRVAGLWTIFCFVLFVALNWVPETSILFAPLFTWSTVVLLSGGLDFIANKLSLNKNIFIGAIALLCLFAGAAELVNINDFILTRL